MAADIGMDATTSLDEAYAEALARARRGGEGHRPAVCAVPAATQRDPDELGAAARADRCPRLTRSRVDHHRRGASAVPRRGSRQAHVSSCVALRALRRRLSRAADAGGEAPRERPAGGPRRVPGARGGVADGRARRRGTAKGSPLTTTARPLVGQAVPADRGRGAAARAGAVHGRHRAGAARPARGDRALALRACAHRRHRRLGGARGAGRPRRAHRRGRGGALTAVPGRRRERRAVLVGRGRQRPLRRRAGRGRRRRLPLRRGGCRRARAGRLGPARPRGADRARALVLVRRRRGGVRGRRRRRAPRVHVPALVVHAGGVLRRDRRLARRRTHRLGELPGPVHAALRRRGRARPPGLEAPAGHAARLRRLLRHQVVGLHLRRAARARLAQARRARALDGGPARASRRVGPRNLTRDDRRGGVRRRRRAARAALRGRRRTSVPTCVRPSRRRSTACTARSPARTASRTWRRGTGSS